MFANSSIDLKLNTNRHILSYLFVVVVRWTMVYCLDCWTSIKGVNYFHKKLHLRCLTTFWLSLWIWILPRLLVYGENFCKVFSSLKIISNIFYIMNLKYNYKIPLFLANFIFKPSENHLKIRTSYRDIVLFGKKYQIPLLSTFLIRKSDLGNSPSWVIRDIPKLTRYSKSVMHRMTA